MPMTTPGDMSVMNLPAIDQAVQQDSFNALRNDAAKFQNEETKGRAQVRDQMEDAKFFKDIGTMYMSLYEKDPEGIEAAWNESRPSLIKEMEARGIDSKDVDALDTPAEQLRQSFANLIQVGDQGMAGRGPDTTYSQPVEGINPDTGVAELYRPNSKGGVDPLNIGAVPKGAGITINTGDEAQLAGDTQEEKDLGALRVATYAALQEAALSSQETMTNIDIMRQLDFTGGPGSDFKQNLRSFAVFMGMQGLVNIPEMVSQESFGSLAGDVLLKKMAKQKGPQTDRDYERIENTFANTNDIELKREFLMNSAYALAAREVEMADFYRKHYEKTGKIRGADKAWNTHKRTHPMVSDSVLDPETKLPMFYIDYIDMIRATNPQMDIPIGTIETMWLQKTAGK